MGACDMPVAEYFLTCILVPQKEVWVSITLRIPGRRSRQSACKPGSVGRAATSPRACRPFLWDGHCWPPHATNPNNEPGGGPGRAAAPALLLFGLAPGGACHAADVAVCAVRSCRTLSPLPARRPAVSFLWRFPWGRPRRTLSGAVSPWSPDFPPPSMRRPTGRLAHRA
jgi:hypothetical protein